ncbi:PfkB family carbohydrate kinase, partial [Rhizobium leguminosarum]|uniref:PfkB family carbohydrate kinase n=1 Tax=Rhizobium leguminosarum TaxID=384 RepID=UPI003F99C284
LIKPGVIGGDVIDHMYRAKEALVFENSIPVDGIRCLGGVARNVAVNLALLGTSTSFVSFVCDDEGGRAILNHMRDRGFDVSQVV